MISWIVASHREDVLEANLLPTLELHDDDELVVIRDAPSITLAYAEGQAKAAQPVKAYVHHDVQILDVARLRRVLILGTEPGANVGMLGVVGSRDQRMPWWEGDKLGSVVDTRMGRLDFGPGGWCAMLDGLLLATRHEVEWDTQARGWHGYDHDACAQMLHRGLMNWCLTGAWQWLCHNTSGPANVGAIDGWPSAVARWRERWVS